jgi:hypothetical protein
MKKIISFNLIAAFIITALAGCGGQNADSLAQTHSSGIPDGAPAQQAQTGSGWEDMFVYDESKAVQLHVKASIPGEEDAYEYPWGGYDDPVDAPLQSTFAPSLWSSRGGFCGEDVAQGLLLVIPRLLRLLYDMQ